MSTWAKPGVRVVYINDHYGPEAWYGSETLPVIGRQYTIREIILMGGEVPCCRLVEIENEVLDYTFGFYEAAFSLERFRPLITRTQDEDLEQFIPLLETKPHEVDA